MSCAGSIALTASVSLAFLLTTVSVGLAADPGFEDPNNWPQYHRTANAWRYSPLDQINKDNVNKLSVAWIAQGGDNTMGNQATPLAIDGVIYSITAGNWVAALDGKTGKELWSYLSAEAPSVYEDGAALALQSRCRGGPRHGLHRHGGRTRDRAGSEDR